MEVLVTGGLGFVGSSVCHHIAKNQDVKISIIDDESKGSVSNIKGVDCEHYCVDITDYNAVLDVMHNVNPEIVIHLAAMHFIPDCNLDPVKCLHTNVVGTENVLFSCRQTQTVKRVIVTSSQAVYRINDNPNHEDDIPSPYDVYGESKLTNEFQANRFYRETGISSIVVRLSNVYGPRETNPHVIPEIMSQLKQGDGVKLGNIEPKRDFIHTMDVARGYESLALTPDVGGYNKVNLASGREYSIREILGKLSKILGKDISYIKDLSRFRTTERMHLVANIDRIFSLVGWKPIIEIEEGLEDLCKWYKLT